MTGGSCAAAAERGQHGPTIKLLGTKGSVLADDGDSIAGPFRQGRGYHFRAERLFAPGFLRLSPTYGHCIPSAPANALASAPARSSPPGTGRPVPGLWLQTYLEKQAEPRGDHIALDAEFASSDLQLNARYHAILAHLQRFHFTSTALRMPEAQGWRAVGPENP